MLVNEKNGDDNNFEKTQTMTIDQLATAFENQPILKDDVQDYGTIGNTKTESEKALSNKRVSVTFRHVCDRSASREH